MGLLNLVRGNKSSFTLLLILMILPLTASSVLLYLMVDYEESIRAFGLKEWMLFYLVATVIMTLALTTTTFIALTSGYFLGWISLAGLIPSYLLSAWLGYHLALLIDKGKFMENLADSPRLKNIMVNLKKDEFRVIFFSRISPVLPFAMMNVFLSYMKTGLRNFLMASMLGMLPRTLLSVWIGTQAHDIILMLKGKEDPDAGKIILMILLIISVWGLFSVFQKAMKEK